MSELLVRNSTITGNHLVVFVSVILSRYYCLKKVGVVGCVCGGGGVRLNNVRRGLCFPLILFNSNYSELKKKALDARVFIYKPSSLKIHLDSTKFSV